MSEQFDFSERVIVDFEDVRSGLGDILDEMRTIRSDSLIREILSQEDQNKIRQWEKLLNRRTDEKFSIVIMGDFKRGKSTLINALLGANIAPMDVSPETITINKISYGQEPRRVAVLKNGKRIRLNAEELTRQELENILSKLTSPIDYIEMTENIDLLKEITIVDTPGLGDLMNSYNEQVQEYLSSADAVIYVVSMLSPLSETEQLYLSSSILPQSFSQLYVAANMADCFDTQEDVEKVRRELVSRVSAFSSNAKVYAVSALDEYCRKMNFRRPNGDLVTYLEETFSAFDSDIRNEMILKKDFIKAQRLIALAKIMSRDVRSRIALMGDMLQQSSDNLREISRRCEEENANLYSTTATHHEKIREFASQLAFEAKGWMTEFLVRLRGEIENVRNANVTTIQKHFQFYIMDIVREAILRCIAVHKPLMQEQLLSIAKDFSAGSLFDEAGQNVFTVSVGIADISWTSVDTVSYFLDEGLPLMGFQSPIAIGLIGQAVAGFIRQGKMKHKQQDLLTPVLESFSTIETTVYEEITSAYNNMAKKACDKLTKLFESEIENSQNAVSQAMQIKEKQELDPESVQKMLVRAFGVLDNIDAVLAKFE